MDVIAPSIDQQSRYRIGFRHGKLSRELLQPGENPAEPADWWICDGLTDLQVNGYGGIDVSDPGLSVDAIEKLCRDLASGGVTHFLPTLTTHSLGRLGASLENLVRLAEASQLAKDMMLGIHLEGPFISPIDGPRGAHPQAFCRPPDVEVFRQLQDHAKGRITILTLSPEYEQAPEVIGRIRDELIVSIGHTAATPEQIRIAVDCGARMSTHLGNGMHPVLPRHPNYLWEQLADDRLVAGLIGDGVHLDPAVIKSMVRAKGIQRCFLVSDSTLLSGMPPGLYPNSALGDVEVTADRRLVIAGQRTLNAGAYRPLKDAVPFLLRNQVATFEEVMRMMIDNPRRILAEGETDDNWPACWKDSFTLFRWDAEYRLEIGATVVSGELVFAGDDDLRRMLATTSE